MSAAARSFGPYQLERRLGMGGMAETFEAVRLGPGGFEQRVCIKRILPSLEQDAEFVRLFLEEARVAARLRHANIVQVIDFGVAEGSHYLALELVHGCDLRALVRAEKARAAALGGAAQGGAAQGLTSGLVAFVAQELAVALEVAHGGAEAIVHRDISPSNVLLSTAGEVKLSDFGIARAMSNHDATATRTVKGKVPYMAPEYALRGVVDRRIDLFALGVLLYECLAGVRPFDGANEFDTLSNLEQGAHVPLRERCPSAPAVLVDLVERLISADPAQRPQSATAVLDALVEVAPPPTARRILGELVRRERAARPGGDAHGTEVDALAQTYIAPTPSAAPSVAALSSAAQSHGAPTSAAGTTAPARASERPAPTTAVLTDAQRDARPAAALPFEAAASTDVTRTATPARAVADAETRAPLTRTLVDAAGALRLATPALVEAASDAGDADAGVPDADEPDADEPDADGPDADEPDADEPDADEPDTDEQPPREPTDAGREPDARSPAAPADLAASRPPAPKPRAPLGLVALGAVALLGSAGLAAFVGTTGRGSPTAPRVSPRTPDTAPAAAVPAVEVPAPPAPVVVARPAEAPIAAPVAAPIETARQAAPPSARTTRTTRSAAALAPTAAASDDDDLTTRALLSVVSDGDVYIDGRRAGSSAVTVSLPPGHHVVAAGADADAASTAVDLARGERRRVVLR